ncbi:hypothetical protein ATK74_0618 [Propionicimonas paludicola]|uniref:Uncharacterized protein n=1 Tax=Propionicimonas paludicola TaxID=185243 RepID=A0A2A9CP22_9ACTN|nr:hypothetical protein [Propionicimonas paludicola]PFG16088.1 hypothetical protein ATK74_0618 [Propionicimonas paludicola]
MGLLKNLKDMKDMVAAAPGMIETANALGAQAQAQAAAATQAGGQAQVNALNTASYGQPSAAALEPIAGVSLETYTAVVKGISAFGYDSDRLPEVAASMGISAADWAIAQPGWGERIQADRALGNRFNVLYTQA